MANYLATDTDLTSVANAIRTKGGTSAQLEFPSGFVSAIGAIPSGGGNTKVAFAIRDYKVPSQKWVVQNSFPNYIATGGCFHVIYTLQPNSNTSSDLMIPGIGIGQMSGWTLDASTPCLYPIIPKNTADPSNYSIVFYFRGAKSNTSMLVRDIVDENLKLDIKFYSNRYVDVHTNTTYQYNSTMQAWWNVFVTKSYFSVGQNQSGPLTGAIVELLAVEEA